jgi:hypothetical protein
VTGGAVLADGLLAIRGRVRCVVTAKAAGRVRVSQVIGIGAPGHVHVGEDIAVVNCQNGVARLLNVGFALRIYLRVGLFVVRFNRRFSAAIRSHNPSVLRISGDDSPTALNLTAIS